MNRGTLPVIARLQSLQAVASFVSGGARLIADDADRNPLAALLREINETMLARLLTFDNASGASLTLEVAGRRVLRVTRASGLDGADACLAAHALEDDQKDDLIKLMQAIAAKGQELRVTIGPVEREGEAVSVGLPVALLADLLLIELNRLRPSTSGAAEVPQDAAVTEPVAHLPEEEAPPTPEASAVLGRFARASGPALIAWLIAGGTEDGATDGPEEMVAHLRDFLHDERITVSTQLDHVADTPGGAVCVILGATLADGHSILCARSADGILLGVIEGDATRAFVAAWVTAFASQ